MKWLKESFRHFGKADPLILGSSVAFFTVFAIPGVMVILLKVASTLFEPGQVKDAMADQAHGLMGADISDYLLGVLEEAKLKDTAIWDQIFGIAAILIGGTMAFVALQRGLNRVWGVEVEKGKGFMKQLVTRGTALLIMAGISFLLPITLLFDNMITFVMSRLDGALSDVTRTSVGQFTSFLLMIVVLSVLYKVVPSAKIKWKDIWPGAIVGALLFMLGRYLVGIYVNSTEIGRAFGSGQAVLVVLVWVFMSSIILLFGAFHCHTVAKGRGHGIDPGKYAQDVNGVAGDR